MLQKWIEVMTSSCDMKKIDENPYGCGEYFEASGKVTQGFAWAYDYENYFSIVKCDFVFKKDVRLCADQDIQFLGLRLDYAKHMPPGKIYALLETEKISLDMVFKKGTHFAYTEVIYTPDFYVQHFQDSFSAPIADPVKIVQSIGIDHHWSPNVANTLLEISNCTISGQAAELFYIAKSYELMSALIEMEKKRLPHNAADYEGIMCVLQYIEDNYQNDIKQIDLVRQANMGATKLKSVFKSFTDFTITEYILKKRIDRAAYLLVETDMSIEQIARSLSFKTLSGFSASFKNKCGISPTVYRKQLRSKVEDIKA